MAHPRRLRFAVELSEPLDGRDWLDSAREIEQLAYSTMFVPDHVDHGPGPLAAMAAVAAVTTTLRVGALVLDCDFRHPVLLAKELATIDVLSEGRLEVGLGAGWKATDYESSGIPMDRPGVRVSRLQEHAAVLRGLWSGEPFSHDGEHYRVQDLVGTPAPFRAGGPPILVGGGGPRLLRWAGAAADIVGVNASVHSGTRDAEAAADALPERIDEKVAWLREGAGDRFDELEINAWLAVLELTDDPGVPQAIADLFGVTTDVLHRSPLALIGPAGAVAEKLHERRDRWGYSYTVVPGAAARGFAPIAAALTGA